MTTTSQTRAQEAKFREAAAKHPRTSKQAERLIKTAEELKGIAERREQSGWRR